MCGIAGIFDQAGRPVDRGILEGMTNAMAHRGPDGVGFFVDGEIGLGHRRLSIIDVDGGSQPISNEDGTLQIVFNGEIYNYLELRKELEGLGHRFKTRSDTEVIVHAYEQWGTRCPDLLNGMFAFLIADVRQRTLFVARDHLGIKPLYYAKVGSQLLFSSEIKPLLMHPRCGREIDATALAELFTFRFVPSPKTLFEGIRKLPPGRSMRVTAKDIAIERFWTWVPPRHKKVDERELVVQYQDLLEDAVRLQLRSDVPLGLFLSSGLDSSALLALMSQHSSRPIETFTIDFEGGGETNEGHDAHRVAQQFGARHYSMQITPADYADYYSRFMEDLEEPVGHEAAAAFYFVAKLARRQVKVALSGQGADEPWAGYHRYIGVKLSQVYSRLPGAATRGIARLVLHTPGRLERLKRGVASLDEPDLLKRFTKIYSYFNEDMKAALYKGAMRAELLAAPYQSMEAIRQLQLDVRHLDPLSQMLYIDTRANLPDDLLMVADKTSMANSLEVRVPFLDRRLVEFVESLPPSLKLRRFTGKYLHKKALSKWLPSHVVHRKKKGFANPLGRWMRTSMRPLVEDCLFSGGTFIARHFDQGYIRRMVDQDRQGREDYTRQIYLLLSLELWHQRLVRGEGRS